MMKISSIQPGLCQVSQESSAQFANKRQDIEKQLEHLQSFFFLNIYILFSIFLTDHSSADISVEKRSIILNCVTLIIYIIHSPRDYSTHSETNGCIATPSTNQPTLKKKIHLLRTPNNGGTCLSVAPKQHLHVDRNDLNVLPSVSMFLLATWLSWRIIRFQFTRSFFFSFRLCRYIIISATLLRLRWIYDYSCVFYLQALRHGE